MLFSKKIKMNVILKNLLFSSIILICLVVLLLKINKKCNNCIIKDPEKIFNLQGYAFDINYNKVDDYYDNKVEPSYTPIKQNKVYIDKTKTTGFMTDTQDRTFLNERSSN